MSIVAPEKADTMAGGSINLRIGVTIPPEAAGGGVNREFRPHSEITVRAEFYSFGLWISVSNCSRRARRIFFSFRETCTWVRPNRSAVCCWVRA